MLQGPFSQTLQVNPWPTVSPLTDTEIGIEGDLPWDGIDGPHYILDDNEVEYPEYDHADYTLNALNNKFSLTLTGKVDVVEYQTRVVSMARAYRALGSRSRRGKSSLGYHFFQTNFPARFRIRFCKQRDSKFLDFSYIQVRSVSTWSTQTLTG